jgi:tetratricopeptide (TPR) repeat protein
LGRSTVGEDHPDTILSLNNYAWCLYLLKRFPEAEPLFKQALEQRLRIQGKDHRNTIMSMKNYAVTLRALGRASEAEPMAREALSRAMSNPMMGPGHVSTRSCAAAHAHCLDALGRAEEAATIRTQFKLPPPATRPTTSQK